MEWHLTSLIVLLLAVVFGLADHLLGGQISRGWWELVGTWPPPAGWTKYAISGLALVIPAALSGIPLYIWRRHRELQDAPLPLLIERFGRLTYSPSYRPLASLASASTLVLGAAMLPVTLGWLGPWPWWMGLLLVGGMWATITMPLHVGEGMLPPDETAGGKKSGADVPEYTRPSATEMVAQLKAGPSYRGQISATATSPAELLEPYADPIGLGALLQNSPALVAMQRLGIEGLHQLYRQQGQAWKQLLARPDRGQRAVVLTSPGHSGRSTLIALATLDLSLRQGWSTLFVCPDEESAHHLEERLGRSFRQMDWEWGLHSLSIPSVAQYDEEIRSALERVGAAAAGGKEDHSLTGLMPDILIVSLPVLHRYVLAQHNTRWRDFFSGLGLVVIENADEYQGALGANAALVFRRLNRLSALHGAQPSYLCTCPPLKGLDRFISDLLGVAVPNDDIIGGDGRPVTEQVSVVWNPPVDTPTIQMLQRHGLNWDKLSVTERLENTSRISPLQETQRLVRELVTAGFRTVLVAPSLAVTDTDLRHLQSEFQGSDLALRGLRVVANPEADPALRGEYDAAVIVGYGGSSSTIHYQWRNLEAPGARDTLLCIVPGRGALSRYVIKQEQEPYLPPVQGSTGPALVKIDNPLIVRKHLFCALQEADLSNEEAVKFFGPDTIEFLEQMVVQNLALSNPTDVVLDGRDAGRIRKVTVYKMRPGAQRKMAAHDVELTAADHEDVVKLVGPGGEPTLYLDATKAWNVAYPNAILMLREGRYDVPAWQPVKNSGGCTHPMPRLLSIQPHLNYDPNRPPVTHRLSDVRLLARKDAKPAWTTISFGGDLEVHVHLGTERIEETIRGVVFYDALEHEAADPQSVMQVRQWPSAEQPQMELETDALVIRLDDIPEKVLVTLANLATSVLPFVLPRVAPEVLVGWDMASPYADGKPVLFFYDNIRLGHGGAASLLRNDLWRQVLLLSYSLLVSCPCTDSCPQCCKRLHAERHEVDKAATLGFFGKLFSEAEIRRQVMGQGLGQRLWHQLDEVNSPEDLELMKNEIVNRALPAVLGMVIPPAQRASVVFMTSKEQEHDLKLAGGVYLHKGPGQPNEIKVRPAPPKRLFMVLCHEFAHNWQWVPYDGSKLTVKRGEEEVEVYRKTLHPSLDPELFGSTLPYKGRLFLEGFAQWVEFRLRDYYGLAESLKDEQFTHYNEYTEGFWTVKAIEDEYGIAGVIRFMREGPEAMGVDLMELYERAGIVTAVRSKEQQLREKGVDLPHDDWIKVSDKSAYGEQEATA